MSHHRKLVCGGMFVFLVTTHVGCAGSGLKNMFTRNETHGYHSLDELEAKEPESEVEKPSLAARLASWRSFGTVESDSEEAFATVEDHATEPDATNTARGPRFLGLAISKRDNVAPDPFLGADPDDTSRPESPAAGSASHQKTAKIDRKRSKAGEEYATEHDLDALARKDTDESIEQLLREPQSKDALALVASQKPDSARNNGDDEDDSLEKRFEQHFLLNSVGTVAKSDAHAGAATKMASKQRDLSKIADRQIDQFDYLLAADPAANLRNSGLQRSSDSTELKASKRQESAAAQSENSLFAFDQLIGQESGDRTPEATQVAHTTTQSSKSGTAALDVNVANAEALFGAAAARQNLRAKQAENLVRSEPADQSSTNSSAWTESLEDSDGFQWSGSPQENRVSQANGNSTDASAAFARYVQSNSGSGKQQTHSTAFGVPPISAGNVEGDDSSVLESAGIRVSNASASSTNHHVTTADYGIARRKTVHSATSEASFAGIAQLTAAPVAPVPDLETAADVSSQAIRPGLVQSFSARNWLLLIGGIIVIALLFAPGRTKPLTMNS